MEEENRPFGRRLLDSSKVRVTVRLIGETQMPQKHVLTMIAVFGLVSLSALADNTAPAGNTGKAPGPCNQIAAACKSAGFIQGDWKKGDGLWRDCVDPIIQGQTSVKGATKPLPSVDPTVVAACKAKHPKYGEGKVGS